MTRKISLENVIPGHTTLVTKHHHVYDWVITTLLNVYKNYLEVELVDAYLKSLLVIDDKIQCKIVLPDKTIFLLETVVYNVKIPSRSVVLQIKDSKTFQNSRESMRYDVSYCSGIFRKDSSIERYAVIINMSENGLGFVTNELLEEGEELTIDIYFPGFDIVTLCAVVKWRNNELKHKSIYGVEIFEISDLDRHKYHRYLHQLVHAYNKP